jgi:2-polyprenyl-6-methoxyphenol hydroxylase-like FAD-dependent oxidoreductase
VYDVIVIGARCAGATTAMLLARRGHRVLMVDKDPRGSGMAHSTHFVQPIAVSKLKKWGLLPALEAVCPGIETYGLDFGSVVVRGTLPAVDGNARTFCPRREILDSILVSAAEAAGVDYFPNTKLVDLIRTDNAVSGVQVIAADGKAKSYSARLIVGADGPGSTVAKAVDAAHYHEAPAQQVTMWGYWRGLEVDGLEIAFRPGRAVYSGPTSGGDAMIGVNWVTADFKALRGEVEASYHATITQLIPALAAKIKRSTLSTPLRLGSTRNFLRMPYGAGWVLVGDAGHKKDPTTAQGITDAFIDADECTEVIDQVLRGELAATAGFAAWHAARDARLISYHEMTIQMAKFEAPSATELALYHALTRQPEATTKFLGLITGSTNPQTFFAPDNLNAILAGSP